MALFNNRELESLQVENSSLKDKIATLEIRLSAKDKAIAELRDWSPKTRNTGRILKNIKPPPLILFLSMR